MLKKEAILSKTNNGLNVFRYYISGEWRVGHNFLNPLYDDRKASCNVYFDRKSGAYKIKDFGNDDFSGDCFSLVGNLKNLNCNNSKDFVEILQIINRDLRLNLTEENFLSNNSDVVGGKFLKTDTIWYAQREELPYFHCTKAKILFVISCLTAFIIWLE